MSIEVVTSPQESSKFLMHFLISASYTFEKGFQWMNILHITRSLVDFASCVLRELACVSVFASHHHLEAIGPSDSKAEKQSGWLGFPGRLCSSARWHNLLSPKTSPAAVLPVFLPADPFLLL